MCKDFHTLQGTKHTSIWNKRPHFDCDDGSEEEEREPPLPLSLSLPPCTAVAGGLVVVVMVDTK